MSFFQRFLVVAFVPLLGLVALQALYPDAVTFLPERFKNDLISLFGPSSQDEVLPRAHTPLIMSATSHSSHYEKIANVATVLAGLGYPITFITGRIFEDDVKALHPNIQFYAAHGKDDKLTAEEYEMLKSFEPGSAELALFMTKLVMVDSMKDQHESVQKVLSQNHDKFGTDAPLIVLHDMALMGHHPSVLGAPGIRPDSSIAISPHPILGDSSDAFPFHMSKLPHTGPDAKAVHQEANKAEYQDYVTKVLSEAFWEELKKFNVDENYVSKNDGKSFYHAMHVAPDHVMALGIPEFDFPRSDLRPNVHYFGALKDKENVSIDISDLPGWWADIAKAKSEGKKIVAVSQGTVGTHLDDLLLPTLKALADRDDILIIATTVAVNPEDIPDFVVPSNTRVAKWVPYDLLLPQVDLLINNGGYGTVIKSLELAIPMVLAGQGEDKNVTNIIAEWKGVGINLGRRDPSVAQIRDGATKVLHDPKYKKNVVALSKNFDRYDLGAVFDNVIQAEVRAWKKSKSNSRK